MRRFRLSAILVLLLVVSAAPSYAGAVPTAAPAVCSAAPAGLGNLGQPAPQFLTSYLCGTCSGTCSGLTVNPGTRTDCTDEGSPGFCVVLLIGGSMPAHCPAGTGTGIYCICQSSS